MRSNNSQHYFYSAFLSILICFLSMSLLAKENCGDLCRFASDKAFDKFVVGDVVHVADADELHTVFSQAKARGYWKTLPPNFSIYPETVRLVSIRFSSQEPPVSLFMMRNEFDAAPLNVGDFVRYRPHDLSWESPDNPEQEALFTDLTGCIALLCAKEDAACKNEFVIGIYALDGKAYNLQGEALSGVTSVNPETLKPQR